MAAPLPALSPVMTLAPTHKVGAFSCGDAAIDQFLRERAADEQALRLSQVYVTVDAEGDVCAYFTLSPLTIRVEPTLLASLGTAAVPYPTIGGFLLGRLGVATRIQGRGVGEALVMRAAQIAKREASYVGGVFLAVDPKDERLVRWYARLGFVSLGGGKRRMVLPLSAVP